MERAQLLHDLARLDSTEVPYLKSVPTEDGLRNEPANYEYLHKSESSKLHKSGILILKTIDNSSHRPAQSNENLNKAHAISKADATTSVSVNDSECQTDFPVNFCSNPIYEYLSDLKQTGEPSSAYSCQNGQQKSNATQHNLVVPAEKPSGTSISTLAAVAAVAAATFLTQTMNIQSNAKPNVKAVCNQLPTRSDNDGIAKYTPDELFRMMSQSQKELNPDSQRLILNESRTFHSGDRETLDKKCELMASSSTQIRLPTENSNRIARYSLDPDMQLNQNYSILRTSDLIVPRTAPDRLPFVASTPTNPLRPRSDFHTTFSYELSPSRHLLEQNEHTPPTEISKPFTCDSHGERRSRFSERIQIARIAVDERAKMTKNPSQFNTHYSTNVVGNTPLDKTSNESALCPASLRCLMREKICTDTKLPRKTLFVKSGLNELTQNQHRRVAYQPEYIDKKQNTGFASVQVSPQTTKSDVQDPVDSSGLDIDSPSETDTPIHSDDALKDNKQNISATCDSMLTERQTARFKIVQPKGVLVSESPDVRRQRKLEKNNGSQRTVVWMDELYGDSSSGCCTRKCDSMTELHEPNSMRRKTHTQCTSIPRQQSPSGMECTTQRTYLEHRSIFNGSCDNFSNKQQCTSLTPNLLQKTQATPSGHRSLPDPTKTKRFSMS
ncbi:hypothetical protein EG68_01243 [Paragonimus skrjabini miyazakii]|uniref:Uncharacterized protein n=1 Tax=Paragonimus skrjabini miyazakii TaxID=59628 RepID=A0A8S9Z3R1_9TREM|nr:hypothetical protein EG68_01243 [Paragonimus skrjabini miyazakii]